MFRMYLIIVTLTLISFQSMGQSIISRSDWGSTETSKKGIVHMITHITIHHGGEFYADTTDTEAYLRRLQSWSRSAKGWVDIPYHYLIDRQGKIYEGRPRSLSGDTNTSYDPTGHLLICVLGNYEEQELNDTILNPLIHIVRTFKNELEIPSERIKTHRDYTETLCPGEKLYALFQNGSFLKAVDSSSSPK